LDTIFSIGEGNIGRQFASFNLTPLADGIDGGVYFADYDKDVAGFEDLSIMVRMSDGLFDAGNGDNFEKLAEVPVVTNTAYLVELYTDMDAKTYTVYVTPSGGERILLAENYAFRTTADDADDLGKVYFVTTAANDEFKADSFERMAIYTEGKEYWSYGENYGWQQHPIYLGKSYTGKVKIEFDMFANTQPIGGSVSFADIDKDVYGFGDLCMLCRMNLTFYDARNGDVFETIGDVQVAMDNIYHCEIQADMDAKTHSMWVTPPGGERTLIAENFAFRTTANDADDIAKFYVISEHASDQIGMKNLQISNMD
jgi:unsaturated chondroitin disaccharide hydrolase